MRAHVLTIPLLAWGAWGLSLGDQFQLIESRTAARVLGHWRIHEHINGNDASASALGLQKFSDWMWDTSEDVNRAFMAYGSEPQAIVGFMLDETSGASPVILVCAVAESPIAQPRAFDVLYKLSADNDVRLLGGNQNFFPPRP